MSISEQTVKCPICGKPYKFYAFYARDQSACPKCVGEAEGAGTHYDTGSLVKDIQTAHVSAGEQACMDNLRKLGL